MKERICIVVSSAMTVNAFLLEPIKGLSKHYDVYIVVDETSGKISSDLENVTVLFVPIKRKISPIIDLLALFKLIGVFKKYKFKAIHSVTPKAGLLAMIASFFSGIAIRIHIFTGQVWATRTGLSRWLLKQMDRFIALLATNILVDSTSQRQFLLDELVVSQAGSHVLAEGSISGVDTTRFKPDNKVRLEIRNKLGIKNDDSVFLFIGRLNSDKGVLDLATAFSDITDSSSHLLIVGPDEGGMRLKINEILGSCIERVHFVDFTAHPESYMAAADVLCLPSYREGFGSVVIEAAAAGIPAIGSRIYGIEDAIVDKHSGLLFKVKNQDELRSCMLTMAGDTEYAKQLGENARERVLKHFTSEHLASAWLDYYRERL